MSKADVLKSLVDFFLKEGRVLKRSEYYRLGTDNQPVHHRLLTRYFRGRGYNSILHTAAKMYPVEWASIGSTAVEEVKPAPVVEQPKAEEPVLETPAQEEELSPLDKLRASTGESSE